MLLDPDSRLPGASWTVVVPFKGGGAAKSRLADSSRGVAGFHPDVRYRLALAFLCDTVAAAAALPEVADIIVVSSDSTVSTAVPGVTVLRDPSRGLNAAVQAGINQARLLHPAGFVAVLTGDLPCLRPTDLALALSMAAHHPRTMVPDRQGSGTTLITALAGVPITPYFGRSSCEAHTAAGHVVLPIKDTSTVRTDVDTREDFDAALWRGVGANTRSTVLNLGFDSHPGASAGRKRPTQAAAVWKSNDLVMRTAICGSTAFIQRAKTE